jgi:hypothetical protein
VTLKVTLKGGRREKVDGVRGRAVFREDGRRENVRACYPLGRRDRPAVEIVRALRGGRRIARTTRAAAAFAREVPIEVGQGCGELAGVEFVRRDARDRSRACAATAGAARADACSSRFGESVEGEGAAGVWSGGAGADSAAGGRSDCIAGELIDLPSREEEGFAWPCRPRLGFERPRLASPGPAGLGSASVGLGGPAGLGSASVGLGGPAGDAEGNGARRRCVRKAEARGAAAGCGRC